MSRIRALALGVGLVATVSAGGAAVWFAGSPNESSSPAATRDLALAGAVGAAETDVVSAVERGLTAPRAQAGPRSRQTVTPPPEPIAAPEDAEPVVAEPIDETPAPPITEPEAAAVPAPAPVAVATAPAAPASSGAVGVTALEPGETVGVFAGWNGANTAEPELPVIRASMPAVRLGGIGGGQCGGRRGGGTLVLR